MSLSVGEAQFISSCIKNGIRFDERSLDEFRSITIDLDSIPQACGSVRIRSGRKIDIIVAIKSEITNPLPEYPDRGMVSFSLEDTSVSIDDNKHDYEILISKIQNIILSLLPMDLVSQLCIVPEKYVWKLIIDCQILCTDGGVNGLDFISIGVNYALNQCSLPKVYEETSGDATNQLIVDDKIMLKLNTDSLVQTITLAFYFEENRVHFISDPSSDEEKCANGVIVFGFNCLHELSFSRFMSGALPIASFIEAARVALLIHRGLFPKK